MSAVATVLAAAVATMPAAGTQCPGLIVHEQFGSSPETAITYDPAAVPEGSGIVVVERPHKDGKDGADREGGADGEDSADREGGATTVAIRLKGLEANRTFGAHVHTEPCGPKPDDSGPHYQNVVDPEQPSVNPEYANPENEVWLDFTTDAQGNGRAVSTVDWRFRAGEARSVVVHEHATETGHGRAGMAGDRLACVNVPFE